MKFVFIALQWWLVRPYTVGQKARRPTEGIAKQAEPTNSSAFLTLLLPAEFYKDSSKTKEEKTATGNATLGLLVSQMATRWDFAEGRLMTGRAVPNSPE